MSVTGLGSFSIAGGEKHTVVLDIGAAYTKCGFAGETGPRSIIPSEVIRTQTGKNLKPVRICDCSIFNEEELYDVLVDFIHVIYFRHLLVNPKDRRVLIVESILCPTSFRNVLALVLFKHYEVMSVLFAPTHLMSLFTLGIQTALVLDCGYKESFVLPIFNGVPLLGAWESLPLAAKMLHSSLEQQILENCMVTIDKSENVKLSSFVDSIKETVLEDIKVRMCFATKLERGKQIQNAIQQNGSLDKEKLPSCLADVNYPMDGNKVLHISGRIRESLAEELFQINDDGQSLPAMLLDSILKCPIDTRKALAANIVVIGGTAMLPGFKYRLLAELRDLSHKPHYANLLALDKFKIHIPPCKENYTAWLGGAIFGALEILPSRSLSKEQYLASGIVPDWTVVSNGFSRGMEENVVQSVL